LNQYTAYVSIRIILRFELDKSFAVGDSTTFDAMSQFSGLSVVNVKRVVRHAILNHRFFREQKPGIIVHSAPTAVLAGDDLARNAMIVQLEEFYPAGVKVNKLLRFSNTHMLNEQAADALEMWPNSEENNETVGVYTSEGNNYADA
jgi:hypothetical protein